MQTVFSGCGLHEATGRRATLPLGFPCLLLDAMIVGDHGSVCRFVSCGVFEFFLRVKLETMRIMVPRLSHLDAFLEVVWMSRSIVLAIGYSVMCD